MAKVACQTRRYIPRSWNEVIDLVLIFWLISVPVGGLVLGFALLCLVPQAQDLLVELIDRLSFSSDRGCCTDFRHDTTQLRQGYYTYSGVATIPAD